MAGEQVRQELTLDAQKAISELRKLRNELLQANTQLLNTGTTLTKVNAAGAAFPGNIERSARALGQFKTQASGVNPQLQSNVEQIKLLDQAIKQLEGTTAQSSKSILLSWQSVTRIFVGDVIRRSLLAAGRAAAAFAAEGHRLEIQVARIGTISDKFKGNLSGLNQQVRDFAEANAANREEIAAGVYDILTNQVTDGAEAFGVLDAAQKLSIATGADVNKSVSTLSAVIKSYSRSADDAGEISGKLFRIVDIGNFKIEDISANFGRVTSLGNGVGASFDEIGASLATLSIKGIGADESMTLLNNVFLALLNPSEKMREAFRKLGVESAKAGVIAAGGFIPFLTQLERAAPEVGAELSELTGNIRGMRGLLGLGGESAALLAENLLKVKDGANAANVAAQEVNNTVARQLELAVAKGEASLASFANQARITASVLVTSFVAGIGETIKGFELFRDFITGSPLSIDVKAFEEQQKNIAESSKRLAKERVDAEKAQLDKSLQNIFTYFNERRRIEVQAHTEALQLQNELFGGINNQIAGRLKAFNAFSQAVSKIANEGSDELDKLGFATKDIEREFANLQADRFALRFDDGGIRQVSTALGQVNDLRNEALTLLRTEEPLERKRGEELLKQARSLAQQNLSKADASNNSSLIYQSEQAVGQLYRDQISLLKDQQRIKQQEVATAKAKEASLKSQDDSLKASFDQLQKFQQKAFRDGVISEDDVRNVSIIAREIDTKLAKAFDKGNIDFAKILNIREFVTQAQTQIRGVAGELTGQPVTLQFASDEAITAVRAKFEQTFRDTPVTIRAQLDVLGIDLSKISTIQQLESKLAQIGEQRRNELSKQQTELGEAGANAAQTANKAANEIGKAFGKLTTEAQADPKIAGFITQANVAIQQLDVAKLDALTDSLAANQQQLQQQQSTAFAKGDLGLTVQIGEVLTAVTTVKLGVEQARIQLKGLQVDKAQLDLVNKQLPTTAQGVNSLSAAVANLSKQLAGIQANLKPVEIPVRVQAPEGNQMGGRVGRFQHGGFAQRGTDSILAALTAGEHVTPAKQSRQFATQLAAIGAGMKPVGRQAGGVVNNISIGDVNASIPQGTTPNQVRAFTDQLRRAIRKGAVTLS